MSWFDDPTRVAGQTAFAIAAVAAAVAARRSVRSDLRLWWTVALVFALLWLEIGLDWRFVPRTVAHATGSYGMRQPLQAALLAALALAAVVTVVVGVLVVRRRRLLGASAPRFRWTTRVAFAATAALVALFVVEAISLHATDAVLYVTVGPLLAVGWLWIAASALVVGMAAAHSRGR